MTGSSTGGLPIDGTIELRGAPMPLEKLGSVLEDSDRDCFPMTQMGNQIFFRCDSSGGGSCSPILTLSASVDLGASD